MHIGMEQDNYNSKIIESKLGIVLDFLKDTDAPVIVHFLGDIIESVSGLNHKDSWKGLESGYHGADSIINPFQILFRFLSSINNLYAVNIVGGNHDRLQADKSMDRTDEAGKLIAYMLDTSLEGVPVQFDSDMIVDNNDPNLCIILLHGDNKVDNEDARALSWNYGDPNKFNYICTGHYHSRSIKSKDDGLKYRKEVLPSFCPLDKRFGKTVSTGSSPGIKFLGFDNTFKSIMSMDLSLNYD
jgi:UDP-2,3-diacylglucosamine pyrophosphatase LpxH